MLHLATSSLSLDKSIRLYIWCIMRRTGERSVTSSTSLCVSLPFSHSVSLFLLSDTHLGAESICQHELLERRSCLCLLYSWQHVFTEQKGKDSLFTNSSKSTGALLPRKQLPDPITQVRNCDFTRLERASGKLFLLFLPFLIKLTRLKFGSKIVAWRREKKKLTKRVKDMDQTSVKRVLKNSRHKSWSHRHQMSLTLLDATDSFHCETWRSDHETFTRKYGWRNTGRSLSGTPKTSFFAPAY